jgi:hypothetical protein
MIEKLHRGLYDGDNAQRSIGWRYCAEGYMMEIFCIGLYD